MTTQTQLRSNVEAERLADLLEWRAGTVEDRKNAAAELRRLQHNNLVLMDALWKACGDDEEMVNGYIESQGELK